MSEWSFALKIFPTPLTWTKYFCIAYNSDGLTHPSGEFRHHRFWDGQSVSPPQYSMFGHIRRYPTFFQVVRFCRMQADGPKLEEQDGLGKRHDLTVAGWVSHWNHWVDVVPLAVIGLVKRQTQRSCNVLMRCTVSNPWSFCLHGCVTRLAILTTNLTDTTFWSNGSFAAFGSSINTNTGPVLVTLIFGCVLAVYRPTHLLGALAFKLSCSSLEISWKCTCG